VRFAWAVGQFVGPLAGTSWGLGFAIRTNPDFSNLPGAVGSYNWSGIWGTYFWIDPGDRLIGVLMIQVPPNTGALYRDALRHLTYAAVSVPSADTKPAPVTVSADVLKTYVGTYDFGPSLSSRDQLAPLTFVGTGLEVAVTSGKVTVRQPIEGGPAERAGVKAEDEIVEIDDMPMTGIALNQVLDKLRGRAGTPVRLKIARKDQAPINVTIVREAIRVPGARIQVRAEGSTLTVAATGRWAVLDFEKDKPLAVKALSNSEFQFDGGDHTRLAFTKDAAGKVSGVVLNPGPLEIRAAKIN
jgi:hypothetical protein